MKTVGIILRDYISEKTTPLLGFRDDFLPFLRKYKINVIGIPVNFQKDNLEVLTEIFNLCDGIIFPGGAKTKKFDYEIMEYLYKKDKPVLGICLGMQIMGKTFNGHIIGKVKECNTKIVHKTQEKYSHTITVKEDSKLYEIIKEKEIIVNSRHSNYVPYTNLEVAAYSQDGLIEAIEDKDKRFFIGVQWHPESLLEDIYSNRLFESFIQAL